MKKFYFVTSVPRKDRLPLLKHKSPLRTGETLEAYIKTNENLYAMIYLLVELPVAVFSKITKFAASSAATNDMLPRSSAAATTKSRKKSAGPQWKTLHTLQSEPGQNLDDNFNEKSLLCHGFEKMGETVSTPGSNISVSPASF